jgi:hypothetical protein
MKLLKKTSSHFKFNQTKITLYEIMCYTFIVLVISWYIPYFGFTYLGTADEILVWNLLKAGNSGTVLLNYSTGFVLAQLYQYFPDVNWYSILLSSVVILNCLLLIVWVIDEKIFFLRLLLFTVVLTIAVYFFTYISITNITVLTLATAVVYFRKNIGIAITLILIALLLRTHVATSLLPLLLFSWFSLPNKGIFRKRSLLYALPFFIILILGYYLQISDKEYLDYLSFNMARANINDYQDFNLQVNSQFAEYKDLIKFYWIQDKDLVPSEAVLKFAPSQFQLFLIGMENIIKGILNFSIADVLQHKFLFLIVCLSLLLVFFLDWWRIIALTLFILSIFVVLSLRNMDRVSMPLLLMWFFLIYHLCEGYKLRVLTLIFTGYVVLFFAKQSFFTINTVIEGFDKYSEINKKKQELYQLISQSNTISESSTVVPLDLVSPLMLSNKLFDEQNWLVMQDKLLMSSWISRHPYFYESHQISTPSVSRKYRNYYEFLMSDDTSFIGMPTEILNHKAMKIVLKAYDKRYLSHIQHCHHAFSITDKEQFWIAKMKILCK